jgi:hypothetical protein
MMRAVQYVRDSARPVRWFDSDFVVHRLPESLLTPEILLSRLHGDVTEKKLDLL